MKLHVEHMGAGPDLVLLHGWGFHSGIWQSLAEYLRGHFRVTLVDLPGHGRSDSLPQGDRLDAVAEAVAAVAPSSAFWLGWSLGGLVALQVAINYPERVNKLVLIATIPRFVIASDWLDAVAPEALIGLMSAFKENPTATLKRFVLLQLRGSERAKEVARMLFDQLTSSAREGLGAGLTLLKDSDLRANVSAVGCSTLLIMGERDPLVPVSAGRWIMSHLQQGQIGIIPGAGHAPFLSHSDIVWPALEKFLRDKPDGGK